MKVEAEDILAISMQHFVLSSRSGLTLFSLPTTAVVDRILKMH